MVAVAHLLVLRHFLGHDTGVVLADLVDADHRGERMLVPGQVSHEIHRLGEVEDAETHHLGDGPQRTEVARSQHHGRIHGQLHGRVHAP